MYELLTSVVMTPADLEKLQKGKDALVGFDRKVPVGTAFLEELKGNDIRRLDYLDWAEDILILQGTADDTVSYEEVRNFAEEQLIEFVPVAGADHRFRNPQHMEQAIKKILEFYDL